MPRWLYRVDFREALTDEVDGRSMKEADVKITSELRKVPIFSSKKEELLDSLAIAAEMEDLDIFNAVLEKIWDWMDQERVWCEF